MKLQYLALIALLFSSSIFLVAKAQDDLGGDADAGTAATGNEGDDNAGFPEGQGFPEMSQEYIEAQRNKLWGCFFLVKHKLYSLTNELQTIFSQAKDGQAIYKKIIGDIFEKCISKIQVEEGQKILQSLASRDFNLEEWDSLHQFNIQAYSDPSAVDTTLTPDQEVFANYFEEMDKQIREKYGQAEGDQDDESSPFHKRPDFEPKIGGISLKEISPVTKMIYALAIIGIIGGVFLFAYKNLFSHEETPYEKVKKAKQEKKQKRDKSQ